MCAQALFGVGDNASELLDLDFDLFSKPVPNKNFSGYGDLTVYPRNPLERTGLNPVYFDLGGPDSRHYILPSTIRVHGVVKVTRENGDDLEANEPVAPVALFPHAMFESIDLKINAVPITDHLRNYPYKAFVQAHYSNSSAVKKNTLINEWYDHDTLPTEDVVDTNPELIARREYIKLSRKAHFTFQPRVDLGTMSRPFPPGHVLSLEFVRSDPGFCLLSAGAEKYRIELHNLYLTCRHILPNPTIEARMRERVMKKDLIIPLAKMVPRTRTLHAGLLEGTVRNAISGQLPNHMMVFILSNDQMSKQLNKNPFHFSPRKLKEAYLVVDGQSVPSERLTLNTAEGDYRRIYSHFMDNIGLGTDAENGIDPLKYITNSFALSFDLSPDLCLNHHLHEMNHSATVDIRLSFSQALETGLTILYISTYDDLVTVFPDKTVQPGVIGNVS